MIVGERATYFEPVSVCSFITRACLYGLLALEEESLPVINDA